MNYLNINDCELFMTLFMERNELWKTIKTKARLHFNLLEVILNDYVKDDFLE